PLHSSPTRRSSDLAFIESALDGELTHLLGYQKHDASGRNSGNSRNGSSEKRVKTDGSEVDVQIPRDRNGEFEPQLIAKHQRRWGGFDETILALYARGMATRDVPQLPAREVRHRGLAGGRLIGLRISQRGRAGMAHETTTSSLADPLPRRALPQSARRRTGR